MPHEVTPIGGYFELERPARRTSLAAHVLKYQSARAALRALLEHGRPRHLWLPAFVCDAVVQAADDAGIPIRFYGLAADLGVPADLWPAEDDWLLYVNYFGLCGEQSQRLLDRLPCDRVILDHAQAYFVPPADCLATLYSPRKFFGVPDGGLLHTRLDIVPPDEQDEDSIGRSVHLLKRAALGAQAAYADFQAAEAQLAESRPRRMSVLTERLLEDADHDHARHVRSENFAMLHSALGATNRAPIPLEPASPALCYPYVTRDIDLRERLLKACVFVPRYWSDASPRVKTSSIEHTLIRHCLPLPIDHRYGRQAMQRMIDLILSSHSS